MAFYVSCFVQAAEAEEAAVLMPMLANPAVIW